MDFDWPASVEDNQNNTSRVGEGRGRGLNEEINVQVCGYEEEKKIRPVFRHGMPLQGIPRKKLEFCTMNPRVKRRKACE